MTLADLADVAEKFNKQIHFHDDHCFYYMDKATKELMHTGWKFNPASVNLIKVM